MKKTAKAKAIIKLLKQGYSPREVTHRMDVSYNYAWKVKKQLAAEEAFSSEEVGLSEEALIEVALAASQGKGKPIPTPKPEPEVEQRSFLDSAPDRGASPDRGRQSARRAADGGDRRERR